MVEIGIRVLLVDDHQVLRDGLKALINSEDDLHVIAEAETGEQGIELAQKLAPDVVVMDLGMPGMSGMEAIRKIRAQKIICRIVVLSMHNDKEVILQAVKAGCDGFVPKSTAHTNLLQAIRIVHSGERYLHPSAASVLVDELAEKSGKSLLLENLSNREQEVVRLSAMGYTSREIGEKLALSPKTVDTYRQRAMVKLNLEHRAELVKFALRAGLLEEMDN